MSLIYRISAFLLLILVIFCGCSKKDNQEPVAVEDEINLSNVVNATVPGWKADKERVIDNKKNLKLYAGRLADLYLSYGFKKLVTKEYKNSSSLSIIVEAYDFGTGKNAYGMYSFDTVGKKLGIGQDAVYGHGVIRFWKGRLFVQVVAEEEYRQLENSVIAFARVIAQKIPYTSEKPNLLKMVPEERMVPDSIHFFHQNICLNNIYYMPESYSLGLSDQTDVVTAQYNFGKEMYPRLVLIEYPDELSAQNAYNGFTVLYFDEETPVYKDDNINVIRTEEGEYNSISIKRNFVIIVFESRSADVSRQVAGTTMKKLD